MKVLWQLNSEIVDLWVLFILKNNEGYLSVRIKTGEFDPGSEQTLAACLTHASRTRKFASADE